MKWTAKEKHALGEAMSKNMGHVSHMFPSAMSKMEYDAYKRAEMEHATDVAVRINNFRVEYYNTKTGKVVSSHI